MTKTTTNSKAAFNGIDIERHVEPPKAQRMRDEHLCPPKAWWEAQPYWSSSTNWRINTETSARNPNRLWLWKPSTCQGLPKVFEHGTGPLSAHSPKTWSLPSRAALKPSQRELQQVQANQAGRGKDAEVGLYQAHVLALLQPWGP